ncbi:hypothetical protein B0H65DRAFT_311800 [Neurospora tetraspora]|uniref:Plastocyanin-like domain-containing protein n=1 Tax=Neurospora tetraspora TaxID=94610 RepID=A0AAE0MND7_9PEZI|nr:hypothetical protein B0H65DRAFT_311800 [Neurospora tetraspora]
MNMPRHSCSPSFCWTPGKQSKKRQRRDMCHKFTSLYTYNPGLWLLHCHFEWHLHDGFAMSIIRAPAQGDQGRVSEERGRGGDAEGVQELGS